MRQDLWSEARVEQLRVWWNKGFSGGIIAGKFCNDGFPITRSAVIGKANRLGLGRHVTKIIYSRLGTRKAMKVTDAPQRKPTHTLPLGAPKGPKVAPPPPPPVAFGPRVNGLAELTGCLWIEGNVGEAGWFYCNAPKTGGCYCEAHAAMCRRGTGSGNPTPVTAKRSRFGHWLGVSS